MTKSLILARVVMVAGLLTPAAHAVAQTFTFDRVFPVTASAKLDVATERGKITVRGGQTAEIVVEGRVVVRAGWNVPADAAALAKATANEPPIEYEGDTVRLRVPTDSRTRRAVTIAYEVLVPAGAEVTTESESGATRVEDIRGTVSVRTQSAAIQLTDLAETRVHTGSGSVSIDGAGPLTVTTSSSRIEANGVSGDLRVRTQSGEVTASLVSGGDADV